ncbi:hypothetical protein Q5692_01970 [Microcoleus sp. C2C3]|uniref:hypothetical protein n=1 Tax=unclassified Microcoleus TaxID=2642155 RepID=UPI002FD39AA2
MGWAEEPVPSIDEKDFCKRSNRGEFRLPRIPLFLDRSNALAMCDINSGYTVRDGESGVVRRPSGNVRIIDLDSIVPRQPETI